MDLSVVIPTRDRPLLLREAIQSIIFQRGPDREIVVVDDASAPPVNVGRLRSEFGTAIRVIRNEHSFNVCVARDQGVQASKGAVVLHLDDDDRLADGALELAWDALRRNLALDLLFLGVRGFGPNADRFDDVQERAVRRVLSDAGTERGRTELVGFGDELFGALLTGVPMAFQRVIVRRKAWDKVNNFRRRIYGESRSNAGQDPLFRVPPLWNESEWSIYASLLCTVAFLDRPLYLQRCAGQGYFSAASRERETMTIGINMMNRLGRATRTTTEFAPWIHLVRRSRGRAYMNRAYFCIRDGDRVGAASSCLRALSISPEWRYVRFLAKCIA